MKRRHLRLLKQLLLISAVCVGLSWFLHDLLSTAGVRQGRAFDLETELQVLPEEQREAARSKWETLSETEREQARKIILNLSEEQKRRAITNLKK